MKAEFPPEFVQPSPKEVHINVEFPLFTEEHTVRNLPEDTGEDYTMYRSLFTLISDIPPFDILVGAQPSEPDNNNIGITPFNPEIGYQLSQADRDEVSTELKLRERFDEDAERLSEAPLSLDIFGIKGDFQKDHGKTVREIINEFPDPFQAEDFLKRLRLQVFFPNFDFESRIPPLFFESELEIAILDFSFFYPLTTGPLPDVDGLEGHSILLPDDGNKLKLIRAKFVLSPLA